MNPVSFYWIVSFQQPYGNFSESILNYSSTVCRPFFQTLEQHPKVRIHAHFSGVLLESILQNDPELIDLLARLIHRGQLRILMGGFYDPCWVVIPDQDAVEQIKKHRQWVEKYLGGLVSAINIEDSVWDPVMAKKLNRAGASLAIVEETLFLQAGLKPGELFKPFRVEWMAEGLLVLPFHRQGSLSIPFCDWSDSLAGFKQMANRMESQHFCIVQNGDIFGRWTETRNRIYGEKLLDRWMSGLEKSESIVKCDYLEDLIHSQARHSLITLPSGMGRSAEVSSLPYSAQEEFLKVRQDLELRFDGDRFDRFFHGGHWSGFFTRYPESNHLHKKMLWIRSRVDALEESALKASILERLYQAQGQVGYSHIEEGGCYASYLRDAMHRVLIEADELLKKNETPDGVQIVFRDYDSDEHNEFWMKSDPLSFFLKPSYGGAVVDYCIHPKGFNLFNTFARRPEIYHRKLQQHPPLIYDWHLRYSFLDHFIKPPVSVDDIECMRFVELGDFVNQPYEHRASQGDPSFRRVLLTRTGSLSLGGEKRPIKVEKSYSLKEDGSAGVAHQITNTGDLPVSTLFGVEINYSLLDEKSKQLYWMADDKRQMLTSRVDQHSVSKLKVVDEVHGFTWNLKLQCPARLIHHPVFTLGASVEPLRQDYQGSVIYLIWHLNLNPGEKWHHLIDLTLKM